MQETTQQTPSIKEITATATETKRYLETLGNQEPTRFYQRLIDEVEKGALPIVMEHCKHNQSQAPKYLGINRATLARKLERHGIR